VSKYKKPFVSLYFTLTIKNAKELDVPMLSQIGGNVAKDEPCPIEDMAGAVFQRILSFYANLNQWTIEEQIEKVELISGRIQQLADDAKENEKDEN